MRVLRKVFDHRYKIIIVCLLAALTYLLNVKSYVSYYGLKLVNYNPNRVIQNDKLILESITDEYIEPKNSENLFFIDTFRMQNTYEEDRALKIGERHACAVESAALLNPTLNVYLVYVTREEKPVLKLTPELKALMDYQNIKLVFINHTSFPVNTPLDDFFSNNKKVYNSPYVVAHISDAYRLLVLWKYGGIYFDLDVISIKSTENAPKNFACDDDEGDLLGNAIMGFDLQKGRKFTEMILKHLTEHYVAEVWNTNGPICITKVISQICKTTLTAAMIRMGNCDGFHVLSPSVCYPVPFGAWEKIFNENNVEEQTIKSIKGAMTYHLWNKVSAGRKISYENDSVFTRVALQKCPKVMRALRTP